MSSSNEVFLGQKKAVAKYNMDTKEVIWSRAVEDTPYIITTSGECIGISELVNFTQDNITAACGNEVDQTALFSVIPSSGGERERGVVMVAEAEAMVTK